MDWLLFVWDVVCKFTYQAWAGFGWPHAAMCIVLIVVKRFSSELKQALQRINKLGQWAEFQPMVEVRQPSVPVNPDLVSTAGEGKAVINTEVQFNLPVISFPESMAAAKQSVTAEINSLDEQSAKLYLIEHVAFWRVIADFEYISGAIYGGQLGFLRGLSEKGQFGTSLNEARGLWNNFQPTLKPNFEGWSVEQYLNFLTLKGLMVLNGDTYHITQKGREFISWMTQYGRPLHKAM